VNGGQVNKFVERWQEQKGWADLLQDEDEFEEEYQFTNKFKRNCKYT
jgi:hypothetical protein